jgi:hypothetical protein
VVCARVWQTSSSRQGETSAVWTWVISRKDETTCKSKKMRRKEQTEKYPQCIYFDDEPTWFSGE